MPEIRYAEAVRVSPRVRRVTAPNSGRMTGPGTNTYLVGERELALVDPGPDIPSHVDALERICDGRLRWIFVTHTHRDHSPAAATLAARTGAARRIGSPVVRTTSAMAERGIAASGRYAVKPATESSRALRTSPATPTMRNGVPPITNVSPTGERPGQKRSAMRRLITAVVRAALSAPAAAVISSPASSGTPSALR